MKHSNFLSKTDGWSSGHAPVTSGTTVGSPSVHRRGTLLKLLSVLMLMVFGFGQMWAEDVVDELTASDLAATSTTYEDFSGVTATSDAVYAGNSAKTSSGGIQLRSKKSNSGIVSTTTGGTVKSVKITVESGSSTIDVYGSNTAYTDATDLYDSSKQGTKVGSVSATGTVTFTDEYAYVGIRSNSGALYLSKVEITWDDGQGGDDPTYTIGAQSNDESYGTVELNGNVITASPMTGYRVSTTTPYSVSPANSATVAQDGNAFTVTPSANTTVTINFEEIPSHTITFYTNGGTCETTSASVKEGVVYPLPTVTGLTDICEYKTFAGWTQETSISGDAQPTDLKTTSITMGSSDITLNAVYSKIGEGSAPVNDVLNRELTGKSGTSYGDWSGKTATSNAVYAGNSAGGNDAIQLRSTNNAGIITTASGGKATKVTVEWNSNTAATRTITIYGKNSAYSAASDLYNSSNAGTSLGELNIDDATNNVSELTITGDYEYIGIRSKGSALYLNSVTISWGGGASVSYSLAANCVEPECSNPTIGTQPAESAEYAKNAGPATALSVSATGSGTLTYQWYSNTSSSNEGGTAIDGATNAFYTPDVDEVGTFYYYCVVGIQGESCSTTSNVATINVTQAITGITLNKNNTTLEVGGTETLTATIEPNDATNKAVEWESSDPAIATVDENGLVTAVAKGSATITCKSQEDANIKATCAVTVTAAPSYKKVTAALEDWSGEYLLVYENSETEAYVWTGVDAGQCYATATISNSKITKPANGVKLTVEALTGDNEGKYSLKVVGGTNNGKYVGRNTTGNGLNIVADVLANTVSYSTTEGNVGVVINSGQSTTMRFNSATGASNLRFRYYGSGQQPVQLYRKVVTSAVTITAPAEGTGLLTIANGQTPIASGDNIDAGTELTVTATPNTENHYIGGTVVVKDGNNTDVTSQVLSGTTLTMPEYAITVSATFTPTYAITGASVVGGSFSWEDEGENENPAYVAAGVLVQASANATAGYVFGGTFDIYQTGTPATKVTDADGLFEMPAYAVTIGGTFNEAPTITLSQTSTMAFTKVATGASTSAKFTVSAANLTAGSLSVTNGGTNPDKFNLSVGSITVTAGAVTDAEVTVTPVTSVAGDYTATITVDDGEGGAAAQSFNVTLHVEDQYTAKWWVNGVEQTTYSVTEFAGADLTFPDAPTPTGNCAGTEFMGWLTAPLDEASADEPEGLIKTYTGHTMPAADVNYYAVFAEEGVGAPASVMTEDFASITTGNSTSTSGSSSHWTPNTNFNQTKNNVFEAGGAIRLGKTGSLETKSLDLSSGAVTVNFKLKGWSNSEYTVSVQVDNQTVQSATCTGYIGSGDFESKSLTFDAGTTASTVKFTTSSGVRVFVDDIDIQVPGVSYSNYVTTCVACSNVSLVEAGETNGTITLKQGTKAVSSVKTCNGAVTLTTNAVAEPGYELTKIELSGVANATVNQEMTEITIPANATGELTVTATFSQKNYEVIVEEYPVIGATLTGATTTAHYNDEITISTNEPAGYKFSGWCMYEVTDIERETDIADQFFTGDYDEYEFATTAKFKMPNRSIVAEANFKKIYSVDEFMDTEFTKTNNKWYYVTGLVAEVPAELYSGTKMTYVISDDATKSGLYLTLYRGLGEDSENFSAVSDLAVGDKVVVYGQWSSSYKNLNEGNYIITRTPKGTPTVVIGGSAEKTAYSENDNVFSFAGLTATATYNTSYTKDVTAEATWKANGENPYTVSAGGTVTVTATFEEQSGSKDVTVTYTTKTVKSLSLSFDATTAYIGQACPEPVVTAIYEEDIPDEEVTATFDKSAYNANVADTYTIGVSYQEKNASYTVTVKSVANENTNPYTVAEARNIIDIDREDGNDLALANAGNKVYVQGIVTSVTNDEIKINVAADDEKPLSLWKYTLGINFETDEEIKSVAVGENIIAYGNLLYYEGTYSDKYELNVGCQVVWKAPIAVESIELDATATVKVGKTVQLTANVLPENASNKEVTWSVKEGDEAYAEVSANGLVRGLEIGEAVIRATSAADESIYAECTVTVKAAPVTIKFNKVTSTADITNGEYLIVYEDGNVAFDGSLTTLDAENNTIDVVVEDGVIELENTNAVFTIDATAGTIQSASGKYIGRSSDANGMDASETALENTLTIDESGNFVAVSKGGAYLRYNSNSDQKRFRYFKSSTYTSQKAIQLYKKEDVWTENVRTSLTAGWYYTMCLDKAVTNVRGASIWRVLSKAENGKDVILEEVPGILDAGRPYFLYATAENLDVVYTGAAVNDPVNDAKNNGLIGSFIQAQIEPTQIGDVYTNYILWDNALYFVNSDNVYVGANRAYLNMAGVPDYDPEQHQGNAPRRRVTMNVHGEQNATGIEDVQVDNVQGIKVLINNRLFILRGEKMYDATGRLVK